MRTTACGPIAAAAIRRPRPRTKRSRPRMAAAPELALAPPTKRTMPRKRATQPADREQLEPAGDGPGEGQLAGGLDADDGAHDEVREHADEDDSREQQHERPARSRRVPPLHPAVGRLAGLDADGRETARPHLAGPDRDFRVPSLHGQGIVLPGTRPM